VQFPDQLAEDWKPGSRSFPGLQLSRNK